MASDKAVTVVIEANDGIGAIDAMQAVLNAMKDIDTKAEMIGGNQIQWDISKNAPGYSVIMRDEGVGKPMKYVVGKAKRIRKTPPAEVQN